MHRWRFLITYRLHRFFRPLTAWFRSQRTKRLVRRVERLLDTLDDRMKQAGMTRAERRRTWRELMKGRHPDLIMEKTP